ncbi:MAG: EFR1 family ferrodoxin [Anaerotignum sp.]|nr:EFR1 family ferrodoxin [Anaerotignum sp.]
MIFYFSGTGNSYATARFLSEKLGETLIDIAQAMQKNEVAYFLQGNEKLGFVFPVYAWAPPKIVTDFVKKLVLHWEKQPYTFGVCTCGGSAGNAIEVLAAALSKKGLVLASGYSVIMPNNYFVSPEANSQEKQAETLHKAQVTWERILEAVQQQKQGFFRVKKGKAAGLLTAAISPAFQRFATITKPFYVTQDCIGCGLCERVCTAYCIQLKDGIPTWTKDKCNMCLACVNRCPKGAIQYGKKTKDKGQYVNPCWK